MNSSSPSLDIVTVSIAIASWAALGAEVDAVEWPA